MGQPFLTRPPPGLRSGGPCGLAVRRSGDPASLGRKKRSLRRLCILLYPPRPTQPLQPSYTLPWLSLPSANPWPPNLSLQPRPTTRVQGGPFIQLLLDLCLDVPWRPNSESPKQLVLLVLPTPKHSSVIPLSLPPGLAPLLYRPDISCINGSGCARIAIFKFLK